MWFMILLLNYLLLRESYNVSSCYKTGVYSACNPVLLNIFAEMFDIKILLQYIYLPIMQWITIFFVYL